MQVEKLSDIRYLKSLGCQPTWFGLGFIQLRLSETDRMHFWHPALEADDKAFYYEWHDHRYDFHSTVIAGSLTNATAMLVPKAEPDGHEVFEVCCSGGGSEWMGYGEPQQMAVFTTPAGESYWLHRDMFHQVCPNGAVATLQSRGFEHKEKARVIRPLRLFNKKPPVNPFVSTMEVGLMWDYIDDILPKKPGYHIEFIEKGKLGEASKIREEVDELIDAVAQDCRIMELVELSDLIGAVEAFLEKRHPGYTIHDLNVMSQITQRAFKNGRR